MDYDSIAAFNRGLNQFACSLEGFKILYLNLKSQGSGL
jgi:hypothetical protein